MNLVYKILGMVLGVSTLTLAPFLGILWVGFAPAGLIVVPILMFVFFIAGKEMYGLSNARTSYEENLQGLVAGFMVLVVVAGVFFALYDWLR